MKWIYHHGVRTPDRMTNLSKAFRSHLEQCTRIALPPIVSEDMSPDGTCKWSMEISPGNCIETVFIPERTRGTLCVSSQVGCMLDCSFCATGKQGFNGNLTAAEIIAQVYRAEVQLSGELKPSGRTITNVVFMGMGEPLLNLANVLAATRIIMDDAAFGLSKRRVTLSTAGVVPAIYELAGVSDVSLAVSLHAANDTLRNELVPLNRRYPLAQLVDACRTYQQSLGKRRNVTFEYTLIKGVNDQPLHLRQLLGLLQDFTAKINLIPYNAFPGNPYERPADSTIKAFQQGLADAGYRTLIRATRGDAINAACGQLVGQFRDRTRRRVRYIARQRQNPC